LLKQYFYIIEIGKTELTNIKSTIPPNLIFYLFNHLKMIIE